MSVEDEEKHSVDETKDVADEEPEDDATSLVPPFSPDIWAKIPAEARREIRSLSASVSFMGPPVNPLVAKMNEGHISTVLEGVENQHVRDDDYRKTGRWVAMFYVVLVVAAILVILFYFKERPDILTHLITAIGGIGVGFGAREFTSRARGN